MENMVVLMLMANQLKQLAKDYGLFIMSSTQVNANGMEDDGRFKDAMSIRGSKAIVDKADFAVIMTRISKKDINSYITEWRKAAREGIIDAKYAEDPDWQPTHVIDVYKNRRGGYKNVRIWTRIHLGTGARQDLFITTAENQPIYEPIDLFTSAIEEHFNWRDYFDKE